MKKLFYFAMALGLVACQAEKVDVNGGENGDGVNNYISVNILSANVGTRADDYSANGGQYVDGEGAENEVKKVRFFFFDKDDIAADVHHTSGTYFDWTTPTGGGNDHSESVEKILNAVVVINIKEDSDKGTPASIIAVLNPLEEWKGYKNIGELNAAIHDHNLSATTNFVMSNAISAEGGNVVEAVSVEGHLYPTEDAAKNDPVTIYVERVLAKVEVNVSDNLTAVEGENSKKYYSTGEKVTVKVEDPENSGEYKDVEKEIYVDFLGWNTTTTTDKSYLMKSINTAWTNDLLFGAGEPWNWAGIRSFWAINPTVDYVYGPFQAPEEGTAPNVAQALKIGEGFAYPQENAAPNDAISPAASAVKKPTQVIMAGQLVDEDGKSLTIAEYAGRRYADKVSVLVDIANASNVYTKSTTTGNDDQPVVTYTKIDEKVLDYATATAVEDPDNDPENMAKNEKPRYYVYAQLSKSASPADPNKITYYYWDGYEDDGITRKYTAYEDYAAVNKALEKLGHAKVWEKGYTYYFFDIRHLYNPTLPNKDDAGYAAALEAAEAHAGYYGVVRNHLYRSNINVLTGLGTPVYDPDEVIIPEKPEEDNTVIAAEIKILAWRIVNQNVELNW